MDQAMFETTHQDQHSSFYSFEPMAFKWLEWQCNMISDVKVGAVCFRSSAPDSDNTLEMLATWPQTLHTKTETRLHELATKVIKGDQNIPSKVSCPIAHEETVCDAVTFPLYYEDKVIGAVIFLQAVRSEEQKKAVKQLFKWGMTWLESLFDVHQDAQNQTSLLITDLVKLSLQDAPFAVSGNEICNLVAKHFSCKRVALGVTSGLHIQTVALSHQLRFDKKTSPLIHLMESAMEEAIDQNQSITYPKTDDMPACVTYKHEALSSSQENASVLTVPFRISETKKGALLLLRERNKPFTRGKLKILEYATALAGDALALKLRTEQSPFALLVQNFKKKAQGLFSMQKAGLKVSLVNAALLLGILSLIKIDNYTYAKSALEGSIRHVVVAPQEGFIESSAVRAGDKVEAGELLVRLDDRDLKLEENKLHSERDKIAKEYQEALALRQRAKVSILSAEIAQVEARLGLVKQYLERSQLKAPFTGIVVSGDLSQSLGAPVEKGEPLFEISPLGNYRVAMQVDDHDISHLNVGQRGSLRLMGLPYEKLSLKVSRITPVASVQDGGNYFRVEGSIADMNSTLLRPGMQGIAKIKVGEGSVLWVWTHSLFDRLRLWFWSIGL